MEEDIGSQRAKEGRGRKEKKKEKERKRHSGGGAWLDRFVSWNGVEPFCGAPLRNQAARRVSLIPCLFPFFTPPRSFSSDISPGDMRNSDDVVSRIVGGTDAPRDGGGGRNAARVEFYVGFTCSCGSWRDISLQVLTGNN